jgi:hypothetical protein
MILLQGFDMDCEQDRSWAAIHLNNCSDEETRKNLG